MAATTRSFVIQKYNDEDMQPNFVCCCVWVWNLASHNEEQREAESVSEQGAEEYIWT